MRDKRTGACKAPGHHYSRHACLPTVLGGTDSNTGAHMDHVKPPVDFCDRFE